MPLTNTTTTPAVAIAPAPVAPARPAVHIKPILPKAAPSTASSTATATATAFTSTAASSLISPAIFTSGSSTSTIQGTDDIWKERFLQLQQIQQNHRHKQHQLISAAILNNPTPLVVPSVTTSAASTTAAESRVSQSSSSSQRGSSSERSVSPEKTDKLRTIYPSPPMNDDMSMESDSDARFGHGSDFAKPTESQLKLMTSKERRQLRNKLSARNFRVRRKEYIDQLEAQVKEAKQEAADTQRRLIQSELNCQFLRQELEATRLSQSLFGGDVTRMSKEHANLLASLLNPNTEIFPSVSSSDITAAAVSAPGSIQLSQEQLASTSWMDPSLPGGSGTTNSSSNGDNMSPSTEAQQPMQPFVPFDGDWSGLLINRAEVPEAVVDPKDTSAEARDPVYELLSRYEALKQEAELDEQMRADIKADTDRRLHAQTYMVLPKDGDAAASSTEIKRRLEEESAALKSLIYMLMLHLTGSLFEAATLSKTDIVRMYQTMDEPLRRKMMAQSRQGSTNSNINSRFKEWREDWIKRCWPSFYNNRRRVVELINKTGICDHCHKDDEGKTKEEKEKEVIEIARKMEEGVKGKTVEPCRSNYFVRTFVPNRFRCAEAVESERLEAEAKKAEAAAAEHAARLHAPIAIGVSA
ncbi:hypothetical protein BGX33_001470 [Mortierella sp. NVP41]|nr:hypothetical protein BGX33_001470 [Mortierella sp. NVP41]